MNAVRVAFVGLGAIGLPIARRLAGSDAVELTVFDVRADVLERESALGTAATSVADAVAGSDVILTVLPADRHVLSVAGEVAAAVRPGQVLVDFSTIAPSTIAEVERMLAERGARVVGGGLTKSVAAAEKGELGIFVGGERVEDAARLDPIFDRMATEVRRVPTPGAAKALKVFNNMIVSGLSVVCSEALTIAEAHGIDPRASAAHFEESGAGSWPLRNQVIRHVLADELAPGRFSALYMEKDASLALQVARDHGRPAWFASVARIAFRGAASLGLGDHYNPVAVRWFERAAGRPQLRTWGPIPELDDAGRTVLDTVTAAVRAHQALLSLEALTLLSLEGLDPDEALPHLRAGSSDNDFFQELAEDPGGYPATGIARLGDDLRAGVDLAEGGHGIALAWEVALDVAVGLMERHGPDASPASIARSLANDARRDD